MAAQHRESVLTSAVPPARQAGIWRAWGPLAALVALYLGFGLAEPRFWTAANLRVIAESSAVPLILAVGMTFVVLQGSIDLSVEGVMALGSLTLALLALNSRTTLDFGAWAIAAAALTGAAMGLVNGLALTRLRVPSFMASLGVGAAALGVAMLLSAGQPPMLQDAALRSLGLGHAVLLPNLAWFGLAVVLLGHLLQRRTRFGRYSLAIGGDEALARQAGLPVDRHKLLAFTLCGGLAGLGGALESARIGLGHVDAGIGQTLGTITAVVAGGTPLTGGRGGVLQSVVGVLLLAVLANGMVVVGAPPEAQKALQGALVLGAMLLVSWHLRSRMRAVR